MCLISVALKAASIRHAVSDIQHLLQVEHVSFHILNNAGSGIDDPYVRTTYPDAWVSYYLLNNLVALDPVLARARLSDRPFFWSEIALPPEGNSAMEAFASFGFGLAGYSLTHTDQHGRLSVLSFNWDDEDTRRDDLIARTPDIKQAHMDLHMRAAAEVAAATQGIPQLAPREYECLRFTSQGKTYSEIAIILNLSEHTVRSYLKLARVKLNCVSLAQAVAKAVRYRMI